MTPPCSSGTCGARMGHGQPGDAHALPTRDANDADRMMDAAAQPLAGVQAAASPAVRHLRQVLLWPLRLVPVEGSRKAPWEVLRDMGESSPWREVVDEYTGDSEGFHERHYQEFTAFLPYVQR